VSKKAFDKIAAGLREVLAMARGEAKAARLCVPAKIDVQAIRGRLAISQDEFAQAFGFSVNQIKDWQQGRSRPHGALRAYPTIIDRDPKSVLAILRSAAGRKAA
jgi:putative transcriptional regulator